MDFAQLPDPHPYALDPNEQTNLAGSGRSPLDRGGLDQWPEGRQPVAELLPPGYPRSCRGRLESIGNPSDEYLDESIHRPLRFITTEAF